jgi:hypothetical protein
VCDECDGGGIDGAKAVGSDCHVELVPSSRLISKGVAKTTMGFSYENTDAGIG